MVEIADEFLAAPEPARDSVRESEVGRRVARVDRRRERERKIQSLRTLQYNYTI